MLRGTVSLPEDTVWIIKSYLENDPNVAVYYQSPSAWCKEPSAATLFRIYEVAEEHMIASHRFGGDEGMVSDIIPYYGELIKSTTKS